MNTAFVNATPVALRSPSAVAVSSFLNRTASAKTAPAVPANRQGAVVVRMAAGSDPKPPKIPQGFTPFSEQLNGRVAMMGLLVGFVTEMITGRGIVGQVSSIFEIWSLAATLGN